MEANPRCRSSMPNFTLIGLEMWVYNSHQTFRNDRGSLFHLHSLTFTYAISSFADDEVEIRHGERTHAAFY